MGKSQRNLYLYLAGTLTSVEAYLEKKNSLHVARFSSQKKPVAVWSICKILASDRLAQSQSALAQTGNVEYTT